MFRDMRRIKQELPEEECTKILTEGITGILAVNGDDGYPYTVPVNYVYYEGRICIHGAMSGHKVDALKRSDKVCFTVIRQDTVVPEKYATDYICVTLFGRAAFIEDTERKYAVLDKLGAKYRPGYETERRKEIEGSIARTAIIEITPEHITGKESLALSNMRDKQ